MRVFIIKKAIKILKKLKKKMLTMNIILLIFAYKNIMLKFAYMNRGFADVKISNTENEFPTA